MTLDLETRRAGNTYPKHPSAELPKARGDIINGYRYASKEFADLEWEKMWKRVWHVGGRVAQLEEPGDFVVHNFRNESVIMILQKDGSIRAFFNVCMHRGNRMVNVEAGGVNEHITCAYHGWKWNINGALDWVQDAEDFSKGNPCGKLRMAELPCETWGGFIFYSFDKNALPLMEYLHPIPELMANRDLANYKRVVWRTLRVHTNWKFASDNFNESYHLPAVHPQFVGIIDDDYKQMIFEMYPTGHNRMVEMSQPSLRAKMPNEVEPYLAQTLKFWELDPADFKGRARDTRLALQKQRRALAAKKGHHFYEKFTDDELTDQFHHTLFPNFTLTGTPEGVHMFRTEPDPNDPNWSTFDYWYMVPEIAGQTEAPTIYGMRPFAEAEHETDNFNDYAAELGQGDFLVQDLELAETQQMGLNSMALKDFYLADQETRIRRFHEVINDYLEGRR